MDNFKAVYKILAALETGMDQPQFDAEQIARRCWASVRNAGQSTSK